MRGFGFAARLASALVLFAGSPAMAASVPVVLADNANTPTIIVTEKPSVARSIGRVLFAPFRRNVLLAFPVDVALEPTRVYVRPHDNRGGADPRDSACSVDRDRPVTLSPQITIGCPGGQCPAPQEAVWKRVVIGIAWTALPSIALILLAAAVRRRIADRGDHPEPNDPPVASQDQK